ncbi:MAG TPA: hypothetical protein VGC38_09530 [Pseudolabrys sp.]
MNRIKDYAGFVGWFSGLGYIVLLPITAADLAGKPLALALPPGLHALGFLSAVFVTARLLLHAIRRARRVQNTSKGKTIKLETAAAVPPPSRKPVPLRSVIKPRKEFGLRGAAAGQAGNLPR